MGNGWSSGELISHAFSEFGETFRCASKAALSCLAENSNSAGKFNVGLNDGVITDDGLAIDKSLNGHTVGFASLVNLSIEQWSKCLLKSNVALESDGLSIECDGGSWAKGRNNWNNNSSFGK